MKTNCITLATVFYTALTALAAEPLSWVRKPNQPATAQFDTFHGETLDFRCTFTGFGALPFAGDDAPRLYYQTNGMGTAWWSIPATVSSNMLSATFPPSADPGAERLSVFFGAPSNAYAAAQVRFRNSPGATPNNLDPPSVLDWQAELTTATNALWRSSAATFMPQSNAYTKSETDARIAELAPVPGNYITVSNRAMSAVQPSDFKIPSEFGEWKLDYDTSFFSVASAPYIVEDAHGRRWEAYGTRKPSFPGQPWGYCTYEMIGYIPREWDISVATGIAFSASSTSGTMHLLDDDEENSGTLPEGSLMAYRVPLAYTNRFNFVRRDELEPTVSSIVTNEEAVGYSPWICKPSEMEGVPIWLDTSGDGPGKYWMIVWIGSQYKIGEEDSTYLSFELYSGGTNFTVRATRQRYTRNALGLARMKDIPTNHVTYAELEEALGAIPEVDTSNLATKAELTPIQSSVNSMWATLYGKNVWIAITNYMRQVANTVPSLRLLEVRGSQTNMVYSSAEEIEHVVTQKANEAKLEIKGMIPRTAWGSYQSSGEENPSSNAVTVVNSSKIMLTGGGEWYRMVETGGRAIWVLKTNGMMTLGGDTNGYFRLCDAEGNAQIEVVKTADQVVGAFAQDHDFDGDGNFTVTFNASGSEHPKASCAVDLGDDFEEEDDGGNINSLGITVEWAKNGGGMWVATIHQDTPAPRLFVYGKRKISGENLVRNNAPMALDGGIYINNVKYRLVPYSTGGKTYMTLEAWQ